ncbi:hypothetical protein [Parafilimonas sp.]|uniref:hypothetical protein n=1 Tax=Parafilimonas sp. TaxID=1969739 RepID=UPI0039E32345
MSDKQNANKLSLICCFFLLVLVLNATAQAPVLLVTNNFNQQSVLYNTDSFAHTAWKPVLYTDSIYQKSNRTWLYRKFFEEHLLQVQQPDFNIFGDAVFDEFAGATQRKIPTSVTSSDKSGFIYTNTRGFALNGNVGNKFYFQTELYENQASFPGYVDSFIRKYRVVPFENRYKGFKNKGFDFSYSSARLIYTPNRHFLFDLGYGTNFIGDGYRSLLLSDYNTSYPYFKTALTFGDFEYTVMYSEYMADRDGSIYAAGYPRKWGQTYLLDWHATRNLNIGIFNAVISSMENAERETRFGLTHLSPIIFAHASKSPSGLKNNDIYGLNVKYAIAPAVTAYGQFMLDKSGSAGWEKRNGFQVGVRAGNLLKVDGLNAQLEFNTVRPYSYASDTITTAYVHNNQTLAHPLGANFKEGLLVADYTYKRWWARLETIVARYGNDSSTSANYGRDIFKQLYTHTVTDEAKTGQGLHTKLFYGDVRLAYILNKKTNLRLETGAVYRKETNSLKDYKDLYFYFGVRFTFRKLIYDF